MNGPWPLLLLLRLLGHTPELIELQSWASFQVALPGHLPLDFIKSPVNMACSGQLISLSQLVEPQEEQAPVPALHDGFCLPFSSHRFLP